MKSKISVIKDPGRVPRHVNISPAGSNLEKTVGGQTDELLIMTDVVIIRNRDQTGPQNCTVAGLSFAGTIVFAGIGHEDPEGGDELADLPIDFKTFKALFPGLWD